MRQRDVDQGYAAVERARSNIVSAISLKDVQPWKACRPMIEVMECGSVVAGRQTPDSVKLTKDVQPKKACLPIEVMECGSVMLTKDVQP